jgi:hypothetical protein
VIGKWVGAAEKVWLCFTFKQTKVCSGVKKNVESLVGKKNYSTLGLQSGGTIYGYCLVNLVFIWFFGVIERQLVCLFFMGLSEAFCSFEVGLRPL